MTSAPSMLVLPNWSTCRPRPENAAWPAGPEENWAIIKSEKPELAAEVLLPAMLTLMVRPLLNRDSKSDRGESCDEAPWLAKPGMKVVQRVYHLKTRSTHIQPWLSESPPRQSFVAPLGCPHSRFGITVQYTTRKFSQEISFLGCAPVPSLL